VLQHPHIKNAYEDLKIKLSGFEWKDANEYSAAKNDFIKHIEKEAMQWYEKHRCTTITTNALIVIFSI
jgi:hypothetical protein